GAMHDVEADEVCLVTAGHATVRFHDEDRTAELRPGSLLALRAGMRTTWVVHETLRKVYITG
ncbi:cupin domain-containing protein, partial [Arthrobacter deserti]|nr:cupin domain-containing protein [Arthrobacter deserti]